MNIEKIKYYLDVVECRSFTESARRNFVSQTTISQQIAALEEQVGVELINRKMTPIEITRAGHLFYEEAKVLYENYQHMMHRFKDPLKLQEVQLRIEYTTLTDVILLQQHSSYFDHLEMEVNLEIEKVAHKNIEDLLIRNIFDATIASNAEFTQHPWIEYLPLHQETYYIGIPNQHPLYTKEQLYPEDVFAHELIMLSSSRLGPSLNAMILATQQEGYQPKIKITVKHIEEEFFYMNRENLLGFFQKDYPIPDIFNIKLVPFISSYHHYQTVLAYHKGTQNPALLAWIKTLKQHSINQ